MRTITCFCLILVFAVAIPALASEDKIVAANGRTHTKVIDDETKALLKVLQGQCPSAGEDRLGIGKLNHPSFPGGQASVLVASCCLPEGAGNCYLMSYLVIYDAATGRLDIVDQDEFGEGFEDATLVRNSQGSYDLVVFSLERQPNDPYCCPTLCKNRNVVWDSVRHVLIVQQSFTSTASNNMILPSQCP